VRATTATLGLLLAACGGDDPEPVGQEPVNTDAPAQPAPEMSHETVLIRSLDFVGVADDGTVEGFDLDGRVSDDDDDEGCGHADGVDAAGREGIDNSFASLVPVIQSTEAQALGDLVQQSILNGELMLIVDIARPVDEPDACVDLTVWRGVGQPLLGADGGILDRQTLLGTDPKTVSCVPMVDGVVEAGGFSLELPMQVLDVEFTLHMEDMAIRAERGPDGTFTGYVGAGIPLTDFEVILSENDIADLAGILRPLVEGLQDLWPDDEGRCHAMSSTMAFDALPVYVVPEEEMP
jgi:hypothetical protein